MQIKSLSSITLILWSFALFGQTPYEEDDFIKSGSFSIYQQTSYLNEPLPIDSITSNGWNYVYPETYTIDTTYAISIDELGLVSIFPDADLCLRESDYVIVLQHNDSKLWLLGLLTTISGNTMPITFPQPMDIMHFPLSVGENISHQQSIPLTFTPGQLGLTAADLGIPVEPDSIRVTINIDITSNIADYNMFGNYNEAYLENSTYTIGYTVKVLYWGFWLDVNALANSRTIITKNYWMPGYGLPICKIGLNTENKVIDFRVQPEIIVNIGTESIEDIKYYPSPFSNTLYIESRKPCNIQIINCSGKIVVDCLTKSDITEIPTKHLESGLYLVKIDNKVVKILKQ